MKIAFLLTMSLESPSGLGRYFPYARELSKLGHEVHIVALHHNLASAKRKEFTRAGVYVHYAGQMHVLKHGDTTEHFRLLQLLRTVVVGALNLARVAVQVNADLYHIGKPHPQNAFAGICAARLLRKRRLLLDCDDYEAISNHFSGRWQSAALRLLEDNLPRFVDAITVNSTFLRARCRALGTAEKQILYIPNGVDHERFGEVIPTAVSALRDRLSLSGKRVVLYVGSISLVNHPLDLLMKAFARLTTKMDDGILVLVGGGRDLPTLKDMAEQLGISESCRFVGRVPASEVLNLFQLADVSVDPVYDDDVARARCPVKIMESLVCGIPVVTGDVGDRREMLGNQQAGLVVEPGCPQALADGLYAILKDDDLRSTFAANCADQAMAYDVRNFVRRLADFYEERV